VHLFVQSSISDILKDLYVFKNMKIHFVSFGNSSFEPTLERLRKQAEDSKFFDYIHCYKEKDLDDDFVKTHGNFIKNNKRGYGYWIWKPQVVLQTFRKMNGGDMLVYADGGCSIKVQNKPLYDDWVEKCKIDGSVNFRLLYTEKHWCKMDLADRMNATKDMLDSGQFMATVFFLIKNDKNVKLVEKWLEIASDYHMIDDSPSQIRNDISFKEHRHDQSIFSLLRKIADFQGTLDYPDNHQDISPIAGSRIRRC
jgi:hypothetical protein